MKKLDFHVHCSSDNPEQLEALADIARKNQCYIALSGGLHYGGHDFVPNEKVVEICKKYSDCFLPLAKFELWDTVNVEDIYRYKEMGVRAIKFIYPYYEYDHDLYMPVYEACEKCGLPVLFHTGAYRPNDEDMRARRPILKNMNPLNLDRIARSFQKLHIVMAHLGTRFWRQQAAELLRLHDNLYADLAGCGSWMGVSPGQLRELLMIDPPIFGRDDPFKLFRKLVFGSDAYVHNSLPHVEGIEYYERSLQLNAVPEADQKLIMGGTVASWLGIKLED